MKNQIKNNNGFTIKELIFTIVGIIIAFIAGFALSYIFTNNSKQYTDEISRLENKIQQLQDGEDVEDDTESNDQYQQLTTEDILLTAYDEAINASSSFEYNEIENNDTVIEVTNYDDILKQIFTENGQKIFEEENKNFIQKKDGKVYMLLENERTIEYLYDLNFENINEKGDTITATVVRTMAKEPIMLIDEEEVEKIEKYTLKDELVIKKVNNNWLVDKYSWVITNKQQ